MGNPFDCSNGIRTDSKVSAKPLMPRCARTRIFVQIPAYRDAELEATLLDLYAKAHAPDRLRVVVFWQRAAHEVLSSRVRRAPNLEIIEVPHFESKGCNWARNILQLQWRGEPYTLLLDSHHRFAQGWDDSVLEMHSALKAKGIRRPLITCYLPPYTPETEPRGRKKKPYKIYALERQDGMLLRLTSYPIPFWESLKEPVPADFVSLHFLFADGAFNRDVRFDPNTYIIGDEVSMSLRAYTNGFELFHPHMVLGWHCYDRRSRVTHWDDHAEWREQNFRSLERLRRLFLGRLHGRYGVGARRSVASYERHLQLNLVEMAGS